jgi:preprotein translocase subunit SecA
MDDLKEGINFRSYGQKDPLVEYKMDGFKLFESMLDTIAIGTINFIFKFTIQAQEDAEIQGPKSVNTAKIQARHDASDGMGYSANLDPVENEAARTGKPQPVHVGEKVGRNDPCPCGSGKKYKNCHGKGK